MSDERIVRVVVPGEPRSKARPRFTGAGRVYSSKVQEAHEEAIGWAIRAEIGARPFLGNVHVDVWFYRSNHQRIDIDNLLKSVLDGANGVAWKDDVQVTAIGARLHLDREQPRTVIHLREDGDSTLPRGEAVDRSAVCETCGKEFTWRSYPSVLGPPSFCSDRCKNERERLCRECREPFRSTGMRQIYCSKRCREDAANRQGRERHAKRSEALGWCRCGVQLKRRGAVLCTACWRIQNSHNRLRKRDLVAQPHQEER